MAKLFTVTESVTVGMDITGNTACGHPMAPGLLRLLSKASTGLKEPEARLLTADFEEGEGKDRWLLEKDERDRRALVCLHIGRYPGAVTSLLASTKQEELIERPARVLRRLKPFDEAVGCSILLEQVLNNADGSVRAIEYLIEMQPGAAFVVHRSGSLNGAPSLLTIRWEGRWNMRNLASHADALDPSRYSLYVHGERRLRKSQAPAPMPNFQAR